MSQKDSQSKTIGDHNYTVYMLPAKKSRHVLQKLASVALPALGALAGGLGGGIGKDVKISDLLNKKLDGDFFSKLCTSAMDRLTEEDLDWMFLQLCAGAEVDGAPLWPQFDEHFRGNIGGQFRWFAFCLEAQYGNFMEGWGNASLPGLAKAAGA